MKNVYEKLFEFRKITGKVVKGEENPFFKSKYADLNSVIDATDPALESVGLVYVDRIVDLNLIAEIWDFDSGEHISSTIPLILTKQDMQQLGGAITYARRYARMALCGLQAVDDDGNHVSGRTTAKPPQIASQDDVLTIQGLITQTNSDMVKFLEAYKVQSIAVMSKPQVESAITLLTKKLKG